MVPPEPGTDKERKLHNLELELNDLRQGLAVVADYSRDLRGVTKKQDAAVELDETVVKQLVEDDLEFESIWRFHEEMLIADPSARVACPDMYGAFARYCTQVGRTVVDQVAFEFVFSQLENPVPALDRGVWTGYRLRSPPG
jgi:hypothetical protein